MKKMALALVAAAMVMTGLSAAPSEATPYPGTVGTRLTIVSAPSVIKVGQRANMRLRVTPRSGTATVKGRVTVMCIRFASGRRIVAQSGWQTYRGGTVTALGPRLYAKRVWKCYGKFDGGSTVFKDSQKGPRYVRVVRR